MSIKSLAHVCLKVRNLEQARDFYCGALGMQKIFNFTREGEIIGFYLKASNHTFIEVFRAGETPQRGPGEPLNHFCLETDSIESLWQKLTERGYTPGKIITGADNALQFWVKDPNGLDVEFQQYTDRSSQATGEDVEVV